MKRLKVLLMMCFITLAAIAQSHVVSGTVLDPEGEPLAGASIIPDGGANPGVTDIDGKFSLNLPVSTKTITVSFVGMQTAVFNVSDKPMNIVLQPEDNNLDEVMVVAFGTAKKSAFTGSAAVVNAEELSKHVTTNVASALAGSVPGFTIRGASGTPGSQGNINIRGIGSMYAETNPLIILDGAPYEGNLNDLAQTDIASISVLKDAASAALYGARGATGVILITTKSGSANKTRITFDARWGANTRAVQEYDLISDPALYYETYYRQVQNFNNDVLGGMGIFTPDMIHEESVNKTIRDLAYNIYALPTGESLIGTDGRLNPAATLGNTFAYNGKNFYLTPDDWTDAAYRTGFRQEYNFSVNGGTDRTTFYTSLNYLNEDGVVDYSSYKRVSGRVKADFKATNWLKLGANVSYTHSNTNSTPNGSNVMYFTSMLAPIYPLYVREVNGAGDAVIATDQYGHQSYDYGTALSGYGLVREFGTDSNPLGSNRYDQNKQALNYMNAALNADVNFTPNLRLNVNSLVSWAGTEASLYTNPFYGAGSFIGGELTKTTVNSISTNNVQTLTYFKNFDAHYLNAMIGHEYYRSTAKDISGYSYGGFSPDVPELAAFASPVTNTSSTINYNVEGWFLSLQYNYDERYFASASYRRDGSSRFLKSHRWGDFWSVGGAWLINREAFMTQASWVNLLKLKASIGQQGNDNIGNFAYYSMYGLTPAADGKSMIPTFSQLGNPDITWETTTNFNLGLEWGLFDNRLIGQFEFYNKKTTDLLFFLSLPRSTGAKGYYDNIGDIRNTGVELSLEGTILRARDYDWRIALNLAHNSTKILKLPASKMGNRGGFLEGSLWYAEGEPLYNYMCPVFAGLNEDGQALYYQDTELLNADGTSMDTSRPGVNRDATTTNSSLASRYVMGSTLPKLNGGFSTSARIKWFDISLTFDYQIGGKIFDQHYQYLVSPTEANGTVAGMNFHKDVLNCWSTDNTSSDMPRWYYGDTSSAAGSDRFLTNASYLNFHSFTVGFNMPRKWVGGYADVRLYASGENLCFWSKRKGFDPRSAYSGTTYTPIVSPVRTVMGGIQLSF